jgi:uncharacterized membrane protein
MEFFLLLAIIAIVALFLLRGEDRKELKRLADEVALLQRPQVRAPAPEAPPAPPAPAPAPRHEPPAEPEWAPVAAEPEWPGRFVEPEPIAPRVPSRVERLVAEHALALVGGVFVLVAAVLFVAFAIDQGWIGPGLRLALALALGGVLVAGALQVASKLSAEERVGRAIGSLHGVLAGTGVAVCFIAIVGAVRLEDLFSPAVGAVCEVLVAAAAVQLARTWRSQDLAAFGMCVGLAAPALVGADTTGSSVVLLAVTLVGAVVLAAWERWPRLLLAATVISAAQLVAYADDAHRAAISITFLWWAVLVMGCIATALRHPRGTQRSLVSTVFVAGTVAAGCLALAVDDELDPERSRVLLLGVLAALHLLVGAAVLARRELRERGMVLAIALLGAGSAVVATLVADATSGSAEVAAWAAEAVAMLVLWWVLRSRIALVFAVALGVLSTGMALADDASPFLLWQPDDGLARALGAVVAIAIAAGVARALQPRFDDDRAAGFELTRRLLDATVAVGAWYAIALWFADLGSGYADGNLLTCGWAAAGALLAVTMFASTDREEAAGLAVLLALAQVTLLEQHQLTNGMALLVCAPAAIAACVITLQRRTRRHADRVCIAAAVEAALVAAFTLARVTPEQLRHAAASLAIDAGVLAVLVVVMAALAWTVRSLEEATHEHRRFAASALALSAWYAVSILVVGALTTQPGTLEQLPQVALTLTWVALGVASLLVGTSPQLRHLSELRIAGYALLGIAALKLVLVDTADLETPARVLAFLVTGLGLLGSAALEQRMRDAPPRT